MTGALTRIPDHVPSSLVVDFDFFEVPAPNGDLHAGWVRLHDGPDLFWTPHNGGHWVATRGDAIKEVYSDFTRFSSRVNNLPALVPEAHFPPINFDPPRHQTYRNLILPRFQPASVAKMQEPIRKLTVDLIEGFRARGNCEFIGDFSQKMPVAVFLGLVDLPESDKPFLLQISEDTTRADDPDAMGNAYIRLSNYLTDRLRERKANPGGDLLSIVATAVIDGVPITDEEMLRMSFLMLVAGLDTVASTLGFITRFLAQSPTHRQQLIDEPALIPAAVEELIRRFSVTNLARYVLKDVLFSGVQLKAGDLVMVSGTLGNLDDRKFENPMVVDFRRPKAGDNLSFGAGRHRCVGSVLARTEVRIFLEEWLKRIPHFHLQAGSPITVKSGKTSTIRNLHLEWPV